MAWRAWRGRACVSGGCACGVLAWHGVARQGVVWRAFVACVACIRGVRACVARTRCGRVCVALRGALGAARLACVLGVRAWREVWDARRERSAARGVGEPAGTSEPWGWCGRSPPCPCRRRCRPPCSARPRAGQMRFISEISRIWPGRARQGAACVRCCSGSVQPSTRSAPPLPLSLRRRRSGVDKV